MKTEIAQVKRLLRCIERVSMLGEELDVASIIDGGEPESNF